MGKHSAINTAGPAIRAKREELGLSQSELSRLAGFKNRTAIGKIESGSSGVSAEMLSNIAKALGTSMSDLLMSSASRETSIEPPMIARAAAFYFDLPEGTSPIRIDDEWGLLSKVSFCGEDAEARAAKAGELIGYLKYMDAPELEALLKKARKSASKGSKEG